MGWYHSHPFDIGVQSHCFLSAMDIATQMCWQRAEDCNGNPWLAIVIDPLHSLAKGRPEVGAFRVYPNDYTPPKDQTPDGTIVSDDILRTQRWGTCWHRYYKLPIEYFMSSCSANLLRLVSKRYFWSSAISSTPILENDNTDRFSERVSSLCEKLEVSQSMVKHQDPGIAHIGGESIMGKNSIRATTQGNELLGDSAQISSELDMEQLQGQLTQIVKYLLFCTKCS